MNGIISGGSPQTVAAGQTILRQGGNAVDAVVAAAFASTLGEIVLSSPCGGGFALVRPPTGEPILYDFFCNTPARVARDDGPLDFGPRTVVYEGSTNVYYLGRASSAVPGDVAGLALLLEEFGTMSLADVLQPSIQLAREGFLLNEYQAYLVKLLAPVFDYDESCRQLFAPDGNWIPLGGRYLNPDLAQTFERIAAEGWQTMYTGTLAQDIVADQAQHGGLLSAEDLANYRVEKRKPLVFRYKGRTVYTNPPPSIGGVLIAYALQLLGRAELAGLIHSDADHLALLAEIQRQVVIVRYRDNPVELPDITSWLNGPHLEADWASIAQALANKHARPDGPIEITGHSSTTHISVIDENGLAVALTTTPGETAGYVAGNTGILMNNMLGEEDLNPTGFHRYQPAIRMASMMSPTVVSNAEGFLGVLGSGGSARLRGAIVQLLSNLLDWKLPLDEAIQRPRMHLENNVLHLEGGYDPQAADTLEARGYTVSRWPGLAFYYGGTHTALRTPDGKLRATGDPRRSGATAEVKQ